MKKQQIKAVQAWLAAREAAKTARARHRGLVDAQARDRVPGRPVAPAASAVVLEAEAECLELEDRAVELEIDATLAQDAAERAAGDGLAVAADVGALRADLVALLDREAELEAALAAARASTIARVEAGRAAEGALRARRRAGGLPAPARVPADLAPREILAALSRPPAAPARPNAGRVAQLRREATELHARLEAERQHAEEQREAEAQRAAEREAAERQRVERQRAELEADRQRFAARREEQERLARAHRSRPGAA